MRVVRLHFGMAFGHAGDVPVRTAFWSELRKRAAANLPDVSKDRLLPSPEECERRLQSQFALSLESLFQGRAGEDEPNMVVRAQRRFSGITRVLGPDWNAEAWRGAQFRLISIRYESLSLILLAGGTKAFMEMVDRHPDVFKELLLALAPDALDEALSAPVSPHLHLRAHVGRRRSRVSPAGVAPRAEESPLALVIRQYRSFVPLLLALAVLFVLAYNAITDTRRERAEIAKREDQFIDRQQKLLDSQAGRIASLEKRLGSTSEAVTPQVSKEAASATH